MIERLEKGSAILTEQLRTTFHNGEKVDPIKPVENKLMTDQYEQKQLQPDDAKKKQKLEMVVDSLNHFLEPANTSMKFKLYEKLNKYYVVIIDNNTNKVVKEIPPKQLLDTYAEMADFLGLLIDKKV